jgi:membrane-bound ClpP family serine protease
VAAIAAGLLVELAEAAFWIRVSRRRRPVVGAETLAGAQGVAVSDCKPEGQVRVSGELWGAVCEEGVDAGEDIEVESISGLTLRVRRK